MKKCLWLILFLSLMTLTFWRLKPQDTTLYMAPERLVITQDESLTLTVYHPAKTHPFLSEDAIASITLNTQDQAVRLRLKAFGSTVEAGPLYATPLILEFPWEETAAPMLFEAATLSLGLVNDQTIAFDGIHVGIFGGDTLKAFSVESLYGIFQDEQFEGLYIRLRNRAVDPLELSHIALGFSDLKAEQEALRTTSEAFSPGQSPLDYASSPLGVFAPGETQTVLVPFAPSAPVDKVPVCIGFTGSHPPGEECMAPFLFIQRQVQENHLIRGHFDAVD